MNTTTTQSLTMTSLADFTSNPGKCLALAQPAMDALREDQLVGIYIDPMSAASTIAARSARIRALVPEIRVHAPTFPVESIEMLEPAAAALAFLHARSLGRVVGSKDAGDRLARLLAKKEPLALSARFCLKFSGIDDGPVDRMLRTSNGYADTVSMVLGLVALHFDDEGNPRPRAPLTVAELDEYRRDAMELGFFSAKRGEPTADPKLLEQRQRAFSLAIRCYNKARSVISYLRYEQGDADEIAPAIANRPGAKSAKSEQPDEPIAPIEPSKREEPVAGPTGGIAPAPIGPVDEDPLAG